MGNDKPLLTYFRDQWNALALPGASTIHFRMGPVLYSYFAKELIACIRENGHDLEPRTNPLRFKAGTVVEDESLGWWGWTYTIERTVPMEFRN